MIVRLPAIESFHYQMPFWKAMDNGATRSVKAWHRRAGKDITDFSYLVREAMKRKGTYYYYFPTLELAKKALWDNIVEFYHHGELVASGNMIDILCPPEIRVSKNNSDHFIKLLNGSIIKLGGTDNLSVIGMNGYGYVFSEWQSQKKEAFGFISPILRENGGWALFNGTMRGMRNHLYQDIKTNKDNPRWFTQWLTPQHTKAYYWVNEAEGINVNPELINGIHPHTLRPYDNIQDIVDSGEITMTLARQEYLNDAVNTVENSYYAYELDIMQREERFSNIDMTGSEVYTFWDLGGAGNDSDDTCIVFAQFDDGKPKIIDYYQNNGRKIDHYAMILNSRNYKYGGHYAPHDVSKKFMFGDLISAARDVGIQFRRVPKTNNVQMDIEDCRRAMREISIDTSCENLFTMLQRYHESATGKPCHKNNCSVCYGASHGADAFRTLVMARKLGLVEYYLNGGKKIHLPDSVSDSASEYTEEGGIYDDGGESKGLLWQGFQ